MKPTISEQVTFFEDKGIRRVYDEQTDTWYFSVVDIVGALTEQPDTAGARNYWKVLKSRLKKEGSEVVTSCNRLKLTAQDGKRYLTDVAAADVILRIIQTVPSPKAEPIKLWLAQVGYERMQEMADPAIAIDRARALYKQHGRRVGHESAHDGLLSDGGKANSSPCMAGLSRMGGHGRQERKRYVPASPSAHFRQRNRIQGDGVTNISPTRCGVMNHAEKRQLLPPAGVP